MNRQRPRRGPLSGRAASMLRTLRSVGRPVSPVSAVQRSGLAPFSGFRAIEDLAELQLVEVVEDEGAQLVVLREPPATE